MQRQESNSSTEGRHSVCDQIFKNDMEIDGHSLPPEEPSVVWCTTAATVSEAVLFENLQIQTKPAENTSNEEQENSGNERQNTGENSNLDEKEQISDGKVEESPPPEVQLLTLAKEGKFKDAIELLKSETPKKLVKDPEKKTAAHYAAMYSRGESLLLEMINYPHFRKRCLKKRDCHLATPLHYAMACFSKFALKIILDSVEPADLNMRTKAGDTVFHFAAVNLNCSSQSSGSAPKQQSANADGNYSHALDSDCKSDADYERTARGPFPSSPEGVNLIEGRLAEDNADSKADVTPAEDGSPEDSCGRGLGGRCTNWIREACFCCSPKAAKVLPESNGIEPTSQVDEKLQDVRDDSEIHARSNGLTSGDQTLFQMIHEKLNSSELVAEDENTSAHHQKVHEDFLMMSNSKQQTVLQVAAKYVSPKELEYLLRIASNSKNIEQYFFCEDEDGYSLCHYAVQNKCQNQEIVDLMLSILKRPRIASRFRDQLDVESPDEKINDKNGSERSRRIGQRTQKLTLLQRAIKSRSCDDETIILIMKFLQQDILSDKENFLRYIMHRDRFGSTALIFAVLTEKYKTASKIFHLTKKPHWILFNNKGQSALHLAFRNADFTEHLKKSESHQKLYKELLSERMPDGAGRSHLFYACMGWNFKLLRDPKTVQLSNEIQCADFDNNTLLHALFFNSDEHDPDVEDAIIDDFMETFVRLAQLTDLTKENDLGQNCLHASILQQHYLVKLLKKTAEARSGTSAQFRELVTKLLYNSNGVHAIHSFASKYDLSEVAEPLAELSDLPMESLLQLTVSNGPLKGATCLHFACETNTEDNIEWLINGENRLALDAATHSGLTALDFAKIVSRMKVIDKLFCDRNTKGKLELLCLIDPAQQGIKMPRRTEARQLLASMLDKISRTKLVASDGAKKEHSTGGAINVALDKIEDGDDGTDESILFQALDLDSPIIFRCALRLKLLTRQVEGRFLEYLQQKGCLSSAINRKLMSIHPSSEMFVVDFALCRRRLNILPELVLTRQFELIPVSLSLLLQLKQIIPRSNGQEHSQLLELKAKILHIAVNALESLHAAVDCPDNEMLIMKYFKGKILENKKPANSQQNPTDNAETNTASRTKCSGPKFPCRYEEDGPVKYCSVYKMIKLLDSKDIFATDCIHRLVKSKWKEVSNDNCFTPLANYVVNVLAFFIFLIFLAWYTIDFKRTFQTVAQEVVMAAYLASFTLQEAFEIYRGRHKKHFFRNGRISRYPEYFKEQLNLFDCAAILFMWVGLLWKWAIFHSIYTGMEQPTAYACQMVLSSAFLLWGFRSVSFLSYFETIGPVISMMRSLLIKDLLPFAAITLVIFYSSSVFFFNLLFPASTATAAELDSDTYTASVFLQVFTLPFILFLDNPPDYESSANGTDQAVGSVANPTGNTAFSSFFVFAFLLVVNVVMVNLLIALFSLRVSTMVSRARCIWSRKRFHLMQEFRHASPVPPPFSFLFYFLAFIRDRNKKRAKRKRAPLQLEDEWWKSDGRSYPQEYLNFLKLQAGCLSRTRPELLQQLEKNQPDFDGLKAFTGNSLAQLQSQLGETLGKQEEKLEKLDDYSQAALIDKVRGLENKVDRLIQLMEDKNKHTM